MMKRWIALMLCLIACGALATSPSLRSAAISQLRAIAEPLFDKGEATEPRFDKFYTDMVEELPPQQRAERALELSINRSIGATDYVLEKAQSWRKQIKPGERMTSLITTAMDSPLIEVRMAAFELNLAEYDMDKSVAQVDQLLQRRASDPQHSSQWALWNMALIGARGVDRERVFSELMFATHASNDIERRWAVDALAKFGGVEVVSALLDIAANDPSTDVRERAFCGVAQSGTLHIAERYEAVPGLMAIAENPNSNHQNVAWSYQALREITSIHGLPDDPVKWREQLSAANLLRVAR